MGMVHSFGVSEHIFICAQALAPTPSSFLDESRPVVRYISHSASLMDDGAPSLLGRVKTSLFLS